MDLPRLAWLKTCVGDLAATREFWQRHFGLTPASQGERLRYDMGDVVWEQYPGGRFCGTRE